MGLEAPFLILVSAAACFWFGTVIGKHYLLSRVATLLALALWAGGLILSLIALVLLVQPLMAASHHFPRYHSSHHMEATAIRKPTRMPSKK